MLNPAKARMPGTGSRPDGTGVGDGSCRGSGTSVGLGVGSFGGSVGVAVAKLRLISSHRSGGTVGITTGVGDGLGVVDDRGWAMSLAWPTVLASRLV